MTFCRINFFYSLDLIINFPTKHDFSFDCSNSKIREKINFHAYVQCREENSSLDSRWLALFEALDIFAATEDLQRKDMTAIRMRIDIGGTKETCRRREYFCMDCFTIFEKFKLGFFLLLIWISRTVLSIEFLKKANIFFFLLKNIQSSGDLRRIRIKKKKNELLRKIFPVEKVLLKRIGNVSSVSLRTRVHEDFHKLQ